MTSTPRSLRRRRRLRPTPRGVVVGAAGITALAAGYAFRLPELVPLGAGAVLLALAGFAVVALPPPRLEVTRALEPSTPSAGRPLRVQITVRNLGRRTSPGLTWNDAIPWREAAVPRELPRLPASAGERSARTGEYLVWPPRRGHYPLGPLVVEYGDPFGMARATVAIGEPERLVVVPPVVPIGEGGPSLDQGDGLASLSLQRASDNEDDLTTREYRPGDALRRVHWRVTARQGELMVRQEEARSDPDARILLDTRLAGYPESEPDRYETWEPTAHSEHFEWVVRMAASLASHLDEEGFRVGIEESAPAQLESLAVAARGDRGIGFLRGLAGLRLVESAAPRPGAAEAPRGPVFALLGEPGPETLAWLANRRDRRDTAVAFLAGGSELSARRLEAAGWAVVRARFDDDPAHVWREAAWAVRRAHERP